MISRQRVFRRIAVTAKILRQSIEAMNAADRPYDVARWTDLEEVHNWRVDHSLSALLVLQGITLFIVVPLAQGTACGRTLLDICHLALPRSASRFLPGIACCSFY